MTLFHIIKEIENIALVLEGIESFDYGDQYLIDSNKAQEYPLVFLEAQFNISYQLGNPRLKTVQFAVDVLLKASPKGDSSKDDQMTVIYWIQKNWNIYQHNKKDKLTNRMINY